MIETVRPPTLILSKLYPPRPGSYQITRDHLIVRLADRAGHPLTLVSAPAGSGKSNLLSDWLRAAAAPYGWVSLDERDNELDVFLEYLLAAIAQACPGIALEASRLLDATLPVPLAAMTRALSNDLDQARSDFWLVLDDYHVIDNPRIHELLLLLLEHPPARLHLIIATRFDPPWPLATLRARGRMAELRFPDLRFTAFESETLLRTALGNEIDDDIASTLHDESEGWAAGLHLMALVLQDKDLARPDLTRLPAANDDIGAYLLAEVFSKQHPRIRERLLQISVLGRFNASLCEAVCGTDGGEGWGRDFLAELGRANLFVVPLDAHNEFFRFHHLFREFLFAELRNRGTPEQVTALHRRASDWFAHQGLIEEAIDHALSADDAHAAARLVAANRHTLYNREEFGRLARWLQRLPAEVKGNEPEILLAEARVATMHWRYTEAAVFLARAEQGLADRAPDDPERDALLGELTALRGILEFWDGEAERFLASSRFALDVLPDDASHLRGLAHTGVAAGLYLLGDTRAALTYLDDQLAATTPQLPVYSWLLQTTGFLHWLEGNLTGLSDAATRLLSVSENLRLPDHEATAHYFLGVVHYGRDELEAAERHLAQAVSARYTMRLLWWCQAAGLLGLTHQALGRPDRARDLLDDAHAFLLEQHAVRILPNIGAFQAELHRLQGHQAQARAWAARVDPLPPTWSLAAVDPRLIQIRIFLAEDQTGSEDHAAALLAQLRDFAEHVPNRRLLMEVGTNESLLFAQRGDHELALETLKRVVLDAESDGWVRLFVDLGPRMKRLLEILVSRGTAMHYAGHVLAAFPTNQARSAPIPRATLPALIEPLSEREVDVLRLLSQRYSNKEIAGQLFIAASTVKQHTLNIYRKLEVNDRREAVTKAAELNLIPMGMELGVASLS